MQLTHSFTVPAEIDQAWEVLLDIERIAPCMPGAALDTVDGDEFTGTVKVRLGPIGLTYRGKAHWVSKDAGSHRAVIDAQGRDARGNGTAKATITATLTARGAETAVEVVTDLTITGKPAQFGRGVMVDVGNKLIGQFADCLAGKLAEPEPVGEPSGAEPAGGPPGAEPAGGPSGAEPAGGPSGAEPAGGPSGAEPAVGASGTGEQEVATTLQDAGSASAEQLGIADQDTLGESAPGVSGGDAAPAGTGPAAVPVEPAASSEAAPPTQRIEAAPRGTSGTAGPPAAYRRPAVDEVEPIDLLSSAGPALAKRLAPVAAVLLLVIGWLVLRRRRG